MSLNPVILAIPMYFTLMMVELVYEKLTNRQTYRLNDAITNISTGTLQQVTGTFFKIIKVGIYAFLYEQLALYEIPMNTWTFILLFVLWDLCYYWEHRCAHRISLFWGGHSVHHQSEDYNLSVALRQTSTGFIWGTPFYLPLAILGFHPIHFVLAGGFNLLYQFWIHTEHINRLPRWFEFIFNTPSHHRVHHGRDPKYLDKNYGGVFIIWDRIFGSFQVEEERPNYGVTKPLNSWNPVYANFAHYIDLAGYVGKAHNFRDALKIMFRPPGWLPAYLGGAEEPGEVDRAYQKYNAHTTLQMNLYVLIQFVGALIFNSFYFFKNEGFDPTGKSIFAIWIVVTTVMFGFIFESKSRWLTLLEVLRLLSIPLGIIYFSRAGYEFPGWLFGVTCVFSALSLLAFFYLNHHKVSNYAMEQARSGHAD